MTERFWRVMHYGCDSGNPDHEVAFYLEEGCEGPWERVEKGVLPRDDPVRPGGEVDIPMTASGRVVVPVPFIAGRCLTCKALGGCGSEYRGQFGYVWTCGEVPAQRVPGPAPVPRPQFCSLTHVRWNEDVVLEPRVPRPTSAGVFLYPDELAQRRMGESPCGIPVFPEPTTGRTGPRGV